MIATQQRCPARRARVWAAAVVALVAVPTACGDLKHASLCTAYSEFLDVRADVQAADPTAETAGAATELAESYLARVRRLQQAADGRYGQQLDTLESAVNDVLRTLESIPDDADYATWGPLVEDDHDTAADAAVELQLVIEPSCAAPDSNSSPTSQTSGT